MIAPLLPILIVWPVKQTHLCKPFQKYVASGATPTVFYGHTCATCAPMLEYACLGWGPSALRTAYLMQELESVQKRATRIILSIRDISYHDALAALELQVWKFVWVTLSWGLAKCCCLTLLIVTFYHQKPWQSAVQRQKLKLVPVRARTNRYQNSFVPFFLHQLYNSA